MGQEDEEAIQEAFMREFNLLKRPTAAVEAD